MISLQASVSNQACFGLSLLLYKTARHNTSCTAQTVRIQHLRVAELKCQLVKRSCPDWAFLTDYRGSWGTHWSISHSNEENTQVVTKIQICQWETRVNPEILKKFSQKQSAEPHFEYKSFSTLLTTLKSSFPVGYCLWTAEKWSVYTVPRKYSKLPNRIRIDLFSN